MEIKINTKEASIQLEKTTLKQYRIKLREAFEQNTSIGQILNRHEPATGAFDEINQELSWMVSEESYGLFAEALKEILAELDELRKKPPSLYLIDDEGKTSIALKPEHVYQPPNYVNEGGLVCKSKPIVHPGVSAPLILKRHELSKEANLVSRLGSKAEMALQHITNQSAITSKAIEVLSCAGIEVKPLEGETVRIEIEFGREQSEGVFQGLNPSFHRSYAFGHLLARKILSELGETTSCNILSVELKTNSKKRWYVASVELPSL